LKRFLKWAAYAAAALVALLVLGAGYLYFASEAMIAREYTPARVAFHAASASDAAAVARGAHLAVVTGCTDCHEKGLTGHWFDDVPDSKIWSRNLTILARQFTDAQFEAAIRQGIRPDGQSVVLMPSGEYAGMSDRDLGDIVAYLRSLKPKGDVKPEPSYGPVLRVGVLLGKLKTDRDFSKTDKPSLDLGPKYARGRYLAAIACAECHSSDFAPRPDQFFNTPDLSLVAAYERADFFRLMRTGKAAGDREVGFMSRTARLRFAHFTDDEIDAIYDYLAARGRKMTGMETSSTQ